MCDYSLQSVKTRDAAIEDKLVTKNFGTGTRGFASVDDCDTAICVRPGTEIAFEEPIKVYETAWCMSVTKELGSSVAIFRQVQKDVERMHHDALELPGGQLVMLTSLVEGQRAKVLQLPAVPKTAEEAKEQERVAYAG